MFSLVDVVCEGKTRVQTGSVGATTKLIERHQIVLPSIKDETFGHNLLNQFSEALNQLNRAVGTWKGVVLLVGLRDGNDKGRFPSGMMDAEFD